MSDTARRLLCFKWALRDLLARPRNTPQWEQQVFDMDFRLRNEAVFVIALGLQPAPQRAPGRVLTDAGYV